jgi:hypothetical protein
MRPIHPDGWARNTSLCGPEPLFEREQAAVFGMIDFMLSPAQRKIVAVVARIAAWAAAAGAVGAVTVCYDSLPPTIPLTRWTSAPKSPLVALRIPLINLMTVGLIELVAPALRRMKQLAAADAAVAILFLTAAAKAGIEATAITMLPAPFAWTVIPLVAVLCVGLGAAGWIGRELLRPQSWRQLHMTRLESAGALALVGGILVLNLPLVLR